MKFDFALAQTTDHIESLANMYNLKLDQTVEYSEKNFKLSTEDSKQLYRWYLTELERLIQETNAARAALG
jgi:polyphosphate kinase 2 (PPK2 family)